MVLNASYLYVTLGLQAAGIEYATWDDGRKLCLECLETAVIDTKEAQPLYRDILKFYKNIGMMIDQEIPMLLVERSALNEAREGEKEVGRPHLYLLGGLCSLSIIRNSMSFHRGITNFTFANKGYTSPSNEEREDSNVATGVNYGVASSSSWSSSIRNPKKGHHEN